MSKTAEHAGCVLRSTAITGHLQGLLGEITIAQRYQMPRRFRI